MYFVLRPRSALVVIYTRNLGHSLSHYQVHNCHLEQLRVNDPSLGNLLLQRRQRDAVTAWRAGDTQTGQRLGLGLGLEHLYYVQLVKVFFYLDVATIVRRLPTCSHFLMCWICSATKMGILYDDLLKKLFYVCPKTGDPLEIFRYEVRACTRSASSMVSECSVASNSCLTRNAGTLQPPLPKIFVRIILVMRFLFRLKKRKRTYARELLNGFFGVG